MLSQKEFVEGCYNWYREADLQPGNPEDGEWNEAHYPVPKCKGGTETILLLKEHHAIQGVIQSEEMQHMCIWGWEKKYLSGEYLELFIKWRSEGSRASAVAQHARMTEEEKILKAERCRAKTDAYRARMTEEERILYAEKKRASVVAQRARMTEEEKILWAEKCRAISIAQHAQMTEEKKLLKAEKCRAKAIAQRAREKFNKEVEDLVAVWEMGLRP